MNTNQGQKSFSEGSRTSGGGDEMTAMKKEQGWLVVIGNDMNAGNEAAIEKIARESFLL